MSEGPLGADIRWLYKRRGGVLATVSEHSPDEVEPGPAGTFLMRDDAAPAGVRWAPGGGKGEKGDKGDAGPAGPKGDAGAPGPKGDPGESGYVSGHGVPGDLVRPVGTGYIDVDATRGALLWRRWPAGWRVEVGDTGWRNFGRQLINAWSVSSGAGTDLCHVRRVGAVVEVVATLSAPPRNVDEHPQFWKILPGFGPDKPMGWDAHWIGVKGETGSADYRLRISDDGGFLQASPMWVGDGIVPGRLHLRGMWTTSQPWPDSLP